MQAIRGQHQHEASLSAEHHMMEEPSADISRLYETGNALYRWDNFIKIGTLWHPRIIAQPLTWD